LSWFTSFTICKRLFGHVPTSASTAAASEVPSKFDVICRGVGCFFSRFIVVTWLLSGVFVTSASSAVFAIFARLFGGISRLTSLSWFTSFTICKRLSCHVPTPASMAASTAAASEVPSKFNVSCRGVGCICGRFIVVTWFLSGIIITSASSAALAVFTIFTRLFSRIPRFTSLSWLTSFTICKRFLCHVPLSAPMAAASLSEISSKFNVIRRSVG